MYKMGQIVVYTYNSNYNKQYYTTFADGYGSSRSIEITKIITIDHDIRIFLNCSRRKIMTSMKTKTNGQALISTYIRIMMI